MMDTILNLGLNETVVETIAAKSGNPRWAWDCYRRFIQMYSDVVMEVGKKYFEELIDEMKAKKGVKQDVDLTAEDLKELASQFKAEYKEKIGEDFPDDPKKQLMGAIKAVFRSWDNHVLMFTVVTTISLIAGVLLLTYRVWHLVTWEMTVVQVLHLLVTLLQVRRSLWENSLQMHRVRT